MSELIVLAREDTPISRSTERRRAQIAAVVSASAAPAGLTYCLSYLTIAVI